MEVIQIAIIYFTEHGYRLAKKVKEKLENTKQEFYIKIGKEPEQSLREWCQQSFLDAQIIIFIGAIGIAVRTIAPLIQDKFKDPAVLVLDELGTYVIPILSGHVGRGNEWAKFLSEQLSAIAVITTATDLYGKFAVDVFAVKQKLILTDRILAKKISSAVLTGEKIGFYCEGKVYGQLPKELVWEINKNFVKKFFKAEEENPLEELQEVSKVEKKQLEALQEVSKVEGKKNLEEVSDSSIQVFSERKKNRKYLIFVGIHYFKKMQNTLFLYPKVIVIGIGCKLGKTSEEIERFICRLLEEHQIAIESVCCLASIDKKKQETGILKFSQTYQLPFYTFSSEQLAQIPGIFSESKFVKESVGIGNVCERAAVCAAMEINNKNHRKNDVSIEVVSSILIQKKVVENGITLALAQAEWSVVFE